MKLHHLNASRSQRIVWLLEELGVEYALVRYNRDPQTRLAPDSLRDIHPMGKAPLLESDGHVIAESGAIAQYLLEKFDDGHRLHPAPGTPGHALYLEWMHAAEGAPFLPGLFLGYLAMSGLGDHGLGDYLRQEKDKATQCIESHLRDHAYFAGDAFSAADCMMGFQIKLAAEAGNLADGSATLDWFNRVSERPAYHRTLGVGV